MKNPPLPPSPALTLQALEAARDALHVCFYQGRSAMQSADSLDKLRRDLGEPYGSEDRKAADLADATGRALSLCESVEKVAATLPALQTLAGVVRDDFAVVHSRLYDLSGVSISNLENELRRRGCAVIVIAPGDVEEQWQTNQEADETQGPVPSEAESRAALIKIQRMLDRTVHENEPCFDWGPALDACKIIRLNRVNGLNK